MEAVSIEETPFADQLRSLVGDPYLNAQTLTE